MENNLLDNDLKSTINNWDYATFWQRVGASLLDTAIFIPLIGINFYNTIVLHNFLLWVGLLIVSVLYKPYMEYAYGATWGKMIMKIQVIAEDGGGISIDQTIARYLPWIISQIFSAYTMIQVFNHPDYNNVVDWGSYVRFQETLEGGALNSMAGFVLMVSVAFIFFNDRNQAGHDKLARTYVVRNEEH